MGTSRSGLPRPIRAVLPSWSCTARGLRCTSGPTGAARSRSATAASRTSARPWPKGAASNRHHDLIHVLLISGSLRAASTNTAVLRTAAEVADDGVTTTLYAGMGDLPHFSPDDDR